MPHLRPRKRQPLVGCLVWTEFRFYSALASASKSYLPGESGMIQHSTNGCYEHIPSISPKHWKTWKLQLWTQVDNRTENMNVSLIVLRSQKHVVNRISTTGTNCPSSKETKETIHGSVGKVTCNPLEVTATVHSIIGSYNIDDNLHLSPLTYHCQFLPSLSFPQS